MKGDPRERLVRKAKRRLCSVYGWDEPQAYHTIRRAAMSRGETVADAAKRVLNGGRDPVAALQLPQRVGP